MFFTLKTPHSKRFKGLSFVSIQSQARFWLFSAISLVISFTQTLLTFLFARLSLFISLLFTGIAFLLSLPNLFKTELVRRLIWSRGKLGRAIATVIILFASFAVFIAGEYLSGFSFIVKSEASEDYLISNVDMLAKKESTTTEIPDIRKRLEPIDYTVEEGDNLYVIGSKFKVSVDALKYVNNLNEDAVLRIGQKVKIPPVSGLIHTVKSGENLTSIGQKYQVASQAIADFNYLLDNKLTVGTELVIPGAKVPEPIAPPIYSAPAVLGPSNYGHASPSKNFCVWPSTVRIVTQYFTWYHNGLDIATPWSGGMPPIFACSGGRVIRAGWDPWGLGLHVRIDHGNGYISIYGHMSRLDVSYGQQVGRGQVLGLMGSTGHSTGPHVHFMLEYNKVPQNPMNYVN